MYVHQYVHVCTYVCMCVYCSTVLVLVQVLLGLCSNVVWYGWYTLDPGPDDYQLKAYYWKGSCTVLSSLVIFTRLLFNSAQVRHFVNILYDLSTWSTGVHAVFFSVIKSESYSFCKDICPKTFINSICTSANPLYSHI